MNEHSKIERMPSGIRNLDAILGGGIPTGSMIVIGGPPGSAKTIMSQQIAFNAAKTGQKILFIQTLSEPTVKTLLYLQQFSYFDTKSLHESVKFVDLGVILKTKTLDDAAKLMMDHVKNEQPTLTIIDSFRVFDDLALSNEDLRKFTYQLLVNLIAWETTTLLLGEFNQEDIATNPLFSVVDGIIMMDQKEVSGESTRMMQVLKLRGSAHNRDKHTFIVSDDGIEIFAPRVTLVQKGDQGSGSREIRRIKTGIKALDPLIGPGVPTSTCFMISGTAGSGKTLLSLEFLYRGAKEFGEKGLFVSFHDTEDSLYKTADAIGLDFKELVDKKMIEILCVPQSENQTEVHLLKIEQILTQKGIRRLVIDSVSSFLEKIRVPQLYREKFFQIKTIVHNSDSVCFLPYEDGTRSDKSARVANTEDLVDGLIELSVEKQGRESIRYLEIAKLRRTDHSLSKATFAIKKGGLVPLS